MFVAKYLQVGYRDGHDRRGRHDPHDRRGLHDQHGHRGHDQHGLHGHVPVYLVSHACQRARDALHPRSCVRHGRVRARHGRVRARHGRDHGAQKENCLHA